MTTTATLAGLSELLERAKQEDSDIRFYSGKVLPIAREEFTKAAIAQVPALLARIAALESENDDLRYALEPFARKARKWEAKHPDAVYPDANSTSVSHRIGDFRYARAALTLKENDCE